MLQPVNILVTSVGSPGDVQPLIGIGLLLRARGHRVKAIVSPVFRTLVEQAGLELIPLGTTEDYKRMENDPALWKPVTGTKIVLQRLAELVIPVYQAIMSHHVPGNTVVVASTFALGARIAQDRHQIPTATIHLQPSVLRSLTDPPTMPGVFSGPHVPRWLISLQWAAIDKLVGDKLTAPAINAVREQVGLSKINRVLRDYIHSPQLTIGLFPAWFAAPQADWPPQVRLTGFPLYDTRGASHLSPELSTFLDAGTAPIAFTFGLAMSLARELLEESARACTLLGRRGILLTRHSDNLPPNLPVGVIQVDYAPFSVLLPRCAALVHHGGIGTASQALASGIPQVVLPHAHDQLDNATRLTRLGVARILMPKCYHASNAARALGDMLGSKIVSEYCRDAAGKSAGADALGDTCGLIEGLFANASATPLG